MEIFKLAQEIEDYLIQCRRYLYENPELSDKEENTVALITAELTKMGVEHVVVPQGGVMGFIEGSTPGKTVLLRADIDALPIQEDPCNEKGPKTCLSKVPGVAHLCGHDSHTTVLLGAAKILSQHRDEIEGRVILFFERGEEYGHGDQYMIGYIQENNVHVDGCWALHAFTGLPVGKIGLIPGGVFAGSVGWRFVFVPKEGSNANPVDCAVAVINSMNTARMRAVTPHAALTFAVCKIQSNAQDNSCEIAGTSRFYDRDKAGLPFKRTLRRMIENTCEAYGCKAKVFGLGGPKEGLLNDPTCYEIAKEAVGNALGADGVCGLEPTMFGESFTALSSYYPSIMALLGMRDEEKGITATLHNPKFEANEESLKYGVAATVAYAIAFLKHKEPIPFDGFQGDFKAFLKTRIMD